MNWKFLIAFIVISAVLLILYTGVVRSEIITTIWQKYTSQWGSLYVKVNSQNISQIQGYYVDINQLAIPKNAERKYPPTTWLGLVEWAKKSGQIPTNVTNPTIGGVR